jgi:hypothetical protein
MSKLLVVIILLGCYVRSELEATLILLPCNNGV